MIRLLGSVRQSRGRWYGLDKVVDADFTNFKDLVDEVVDKCPPNYGDIVKLFYSCMDTKANIPVRSDQDLVEMFEKHKGSRCCYMTFCYHSPGTDPPEIPAWDVSSTGHSVEAPFTPSMPCPSIAEPSLQTHTQSAETEQIPNPYPCSEFLCDGEGLYIDIGPQNLEPVNPHSQQKEPDEDDEVEKNNSDGDDESSSTHGFFMHPPLLKSTAGGRRKNRMKSAMEGGTSTKKKQKCPICLQFGHRWYTCKNGNPEDIAAMEALRGPPKTKRKKPSTCSTESSIVVPTPALGMVFPYNEAVANATHKKRKRKSSTKVGVTKKKGPATTTSASTADTRSTRSGTGSNDPLPIQVVHPAPLLPDIECPEVVEHTVQTPRKKCAIKKKLTPRRAPVQTSSPSSPASNTRSKKQLLLE